MTPFKLWAYSDHSGVISFAETVPAGMLPIAALREGGGEASEEKWRKALVEHAVAIGVIITPQGKKERVYVIPGIRDAEGDRDKVIVALEAYFAQIRRSLDGSS